MVGVNVSEMKLNIVRNKGILSCYVKRYKVNNRVLGETTLR